MSEGLNKASLIGNLGADPELRYTGGGSAVLNLRLATSTSYKDKDGERKERTEWHQVVVWGKRAEALSGFLAKGATIFVEGEIRTESYDDKKSGEKRYSTKIHAHTVIPMSKSPGGARADEPGEPPRGRPPEGTRAPARDARRDDPRRGGRPAYAAEDDIPY